jgi:prepilin-type N-terminal cleavage/methylation domain-containing protein
MTIPAAFVRRSSRSAGGFTLVEMIVVIGIIAMLISILLPTLAKARQQANKVACMANLNQIGTLMMIYANDNKGYLFPPNLGWPAQNKTPTPGGTAGLDPGPQVVGSNTGPMVMANWPAPPDQLDVWPYYVFNKVWNPKFMICPADIDPQGQHSYLANAHLLPASMDSAGNAVANSNGDLRWGREAPSGKKYSDIIVVGEKISSVYDYYMDPAEFSTKVEQYRHGLSVGSNYLMMDTHVETMVPASALDALDPWDINASTP